MPMAHSVFRYCVGVVALRNAEVVSRFLCSCFTCVLLIGLQDKWEKPSQKCIRVVHFFFDRPSGLRTQIYKDASPLSIFLPFSQHLSNCGWLRQWGTITIIWTPMTRTLRTIGHDSTWSMFVFGPNHKSGTWFTRIAEGVVVDSRIISHTYIFGLKVMIPCSLAGRYQCFRGIHSFGIEVRKCGNVAHYTEVEEKKRVGDGRCIWLSSWLGVTWSWFLKQGGVMSWLICTIQKKYAQAVKFPTCVWEVIGLNLDGTDYS
jgi:hypothetical protein